MTTSNGDDKKTIRPESADWNQLFDKAVEFIRRGKEEIVRTSRIGKIMLDTSVLQREKKQTLQTLGERVYTLVKENKIKDKHLGQFVEKIDQLNEQIRNEENNIGDAKDHTPDNS